MYIAYYVGIIEHNQGTGVFIWKLSIKGLVLIINHSLFIYKRATAANNNSYEVLIKLQKSVLSKENSPSPFYVSQPKMLKCYGYQGFEGNFSDVRFPYFRLPKPCSYPKGLNKGFEQYIFRRHKELKCWIISKNLYWKQKKMFYNCGTQKTIKHISH